MLRLGGAFFLNPRCLLSRCRNEKRKRCQDTALHSPRLVVIRLIRVIRGLNILSFQLQNHSTSLMPIRVIEATERIARKKAECARRSVSFISAYSNAFTGSVQIRENPCSPFHPCSISTKQLDTNMILPLVPAAHRLTSKRCYPNSISFAPPRLCASLFQLL